MKPIALAAVAVVLALPGAAAGERRTSAVSAKAPPRTVLALETRRDHSVLVRLDGRTLRPFRGRKVVLDGHAGAWAYSPDRRRIAFGVGYALGLTLVDVRRMRRLGNVVTRNGEIRVLSWPTRDRIVGVEEAAGLFVVDAKRRRLIRSQPLDGVVYGSARAGPTLVLLVAPDRRIGAPRVVVVDADGTRRSVVIERIQAGSNLESEELPPGSVGEARHPGLAVDPGGNRAFVVGADAEPIAEVELTSLAVSYRTPSENRSLLHRLRAWLEPAAHAKAPVAGSFRSAVWLGNGKLAIAGLDAAAHGSGVVKEPAGLAIVDTRDWSLQVVDRRPTGFVYTAGMLLATGERSGLTGFTSEGVRSFELFPNETVWVWSVLEDRAFVEPQGRRLRVINALTGRVLGTRRTLPRLLYGS